jgi:succinate dehydrogenase / fumarate reductase flavoprotein subunit
MQALVGIVRTESEMQLALERLEDYKARAARVGVTGHREYHAGWHTALDLRNLLTVSEAIARSALERRESRGGHFREDYPDKQAELSTVNVMVKRAGDGAMQVTRLPIRPIPEELKQVIEEQKS